MTKSRKQLKEEAEQALRALDEMVNSTRRSLLAPIGEKWASWVEPVKAYIELLEESFCDEEMM